MCKQKSNKSSNKAMTKRREKQVYNWIWENTKIVQTCTNVLFKNVQNHFNRAERKQNNFAAEILHETDIKESRQHVPQLIIFFHTESMEENGVSLYVSNLRCQIYLFVIYENGLMEPLLVSGKDLLCLVNSDQPYLALPIEL